eukprot:1527869-Rhodomonas_salina.5
MASTEAAVVSPSWKPPQRCHALSASDVADDRTASLADGRDLTRKSRVWTTAFSPASFGRTIFGESTE